MNATVASSVSTEPSRDLINQVNELMHQGFELPKEKLVPQSTLQGDLGLDSLDAVDMLVYIEDRLNVKVDGEKIRGLKTLGDVYTFAADALAKPETTAKPETGLKQETQASN
ncbi:MAG: acyl carrier protein [Bdellovibrionota bacterium]